METAPRRFWIPADCVDGRTVRITGDVLHHVRDVCRMRKASRFEALPGDGRALLVEIRSIGRSEAMCEVLGVREIPPPPRPHLVLALSIPRFAVMDSVLEKAVELGVSRLLPFVSEQSFVRRARGLPRARSERWEKIVRSATQQSGRGELMEVAEPMDLSEVLDRFAAADRCAGVFAFEGSGGDPLRETLERIRAQRPQEVWIFVGSEGGFSDREVDLFRGKGLVPVTLGPRVLRVETACVALVSIVSHELHGRDQGA